MQLRNCINEGMLWFLECLSYFIVDVLILLFVAFVELLWLVYAFLLFMDIFCCLCLADRAWVGTSVLVLCRHEWVLRYWSLWTWVKNDDWCDPSSAGTLTHVKTIETCVESASATIYVQSAIASCFLLFWWGRLGRVHCIKSPEQRSLITS
jgi:hypothetical protein